MDILAELTEEQQLLADELTPKQLLFSNLWLTTGMHGMGRAECYEAAGYRVKNKKVAYVEAHRNLKKPNIWRYCRVMRSESIKAVGLDLAYLDQQLKDIIDGSAVEVMGTVARATNLGDSETGEPIVQRSLVLRAALDELPAAVQASIQSLKMGPNGPEVKMYNRIDALRLAYLRQGALKEGREISGPGGSPLSAPLFQYQLVGGPGVEPELPPVPDKDPD